MFKKLLLTTTLAFSCLAMNAQCENYKMNWKSISENLNYKSEPDWLRDAKFGIYLHWGVYSVPAYSYEWYPRHMFINTRKEYKYHMEHYGDPKDFGYEKLVPLFTAEKFDAKVWVDLFQRAGAKFAGQVAEHHDGVYPYSFSTDVRVSWDNESLGYAKKETFLDITKKFLIFA